MDRGEEHGLELTGGRVNTPLQQAQIPMLEALQVGGLGLCIGGDRLLCEEHRQDGAHSVHLGGDAFQGVPQALLQHGAPPLQFRINGGVALQRLQLGQTRGHSHGVAGEGTGLIHRSQGRHQFHQLPASAVSAHRHACADNLSIGLRFGYKRSFLGLNNASLSISDDIGFNISDYNVFNHKYTGALTMRYYMSLAHSKRFGVFVEARIKGGYGQGKTWKVVGEDKYGTYSTSLEAALNFVPGICIFATDNIAVEVAIGVLGLEYSKVDQYKNQVEHSRMTTSGANFRINPLSIELGTCIYFYTGPHSKKARKNQVK